MTEYICEGCGGLDAPCRATVPDYVGPPDSCLYGGGTKEWTEADRNYEWISVEERLPEKNVEVLGLSAESEIYYVTFRYNTCGDWAWYGHWRPTHWMPLPDPPSINIDKNTDLSITSG